MYYVRDAKKLLKDNANLLLRHERIGLFSILEKNLAECPIPQTYLSN